MRWVGSNANAVGQEAERTGVAPIAACAEVPGATKPATTATANRNRFGHQPMRRRDDRPPRGHATNLSGAIAEEIFVPPILPLTLSRRRRTLAAAGKGG